MNVTKTDLKYIVPFVVFVALGIWGSFQFDYREDKKALSLALRWCLIPSLAFGLIYGYYAGYVRAPAQARWRKILGVVVLSIITSLIFLRSFQGYIFIINNSSETKTKILVSGYISKVDKPKKKKLLNTYTVHIIDTNRQETILDVPGIDWHKGEKFERVLYKGSLGLLYGN